MPTDAGTFAEAKVRLAKVAQYIATFRLAAVAPYLSEAKCKPGLGFPVAPFTFNSPMLYCTSCLYFQIANDTGPFLWLMPSTTCLQECLSR